MTGVTTYQGSFTTPASGTTTVSTVGFQPNAIIFWVSGACGTTNDTWTTTGIESSTGFAAFDGTNYYNATITYMAKYATSGGETCGLNQDATNCFNVYSTAGAQLVAGHVSSVSSSGFVITYGAAAANYVIHYLCIGGDVDKACITTMAMDTSATSPQTYQQFTLPNSNSWTPSAVMFLTTTSSTTGFAYGTSSAYYGVTVLGAMDAAGNQNSVSAWTHGETSASATTTWRSMSNAYALSSNFGATDSYAIDAYLSYNAVGAGSFTMNKGGSNYASIFAGAITYALCLYSSTANEILCGTWTSANSTTETVTTGVTTVQGALFFTDSDTSFEGTTDSRLTIGATDGTNNGCIAQTDLNNKTMNTGATAESIMETAKCILIANANNTTTSTATATFSGAGIAMAWSVGVADKICYIAFGRSSNATITLSGLIARADVVSGLSMGATTLTCLLSPLSATANIVTPPFVHGHSMRIFNMVSFSGSDYTSLYDSTAVPYCIANGWEIELSLPGSDAVDYFTDPAHTARYISVMQSIMDQGIPVWLEIESLIFYGNATITSPVSYYETNYGVALASFEALGPLFKGYAFEGGFDYAITWLRENISPGRKLLQHWLPGYYLAYGTGVDPEWTNTADGTQAPHDAAWRVSMVDEISWEWYQADWADSTISFKAWLDTVAPNMPFGVLTGYLVGGGYWMNPDTHSVASGYANQASLSAAQIQELVSYWARSIVTLLGPFDSIICDPGGDTAATACAWLQQQQFLTPVTPVYDDDGVDITACGVEYVGDSFPVSGTTITNVGTAGSAYNATAAGVNCYDVAPSGAQMWTPVSSTNMLEIVSGAYVDNLDELTMEFAIRYNGYNGVNGNSALWAKAQTYQAWTILIGDTTPAGNTVIHVTRGTESSGTEHWETTNSVGMVVGNYYLIQISWACSSGAWGNAPVVHVNDVNYPMTHAASGTGTWAMDYGATSSNNACLGNTISYDKYSPNSLLLFRLHSIALSPEQLTANYNASKWRYAFGATHTILTLAITENSA